MTRLNKFIADTGYCSRREADAYIAQERVTINGKEATVGSMVEEGDRVEVDGDVIKMKKIGGALKHPIYIVLNKPVGVTCTTDRSDKTNIIDYINLKERIFPVGRLDKDSEGLIILTNDGDIVNKILRAGNNNTKEYVVSVEQPITGEFIRQMSNGVRILGVLTKKCKVTQLNQNTFTIHLTQGLNRQIRRMCQVLGNKVTKLKRVRVLNLTLRNLETGRWRYLSEQEVEAMKLLLESSSGEAEASNEVKARRKSTFTEYRKKNKRPSKQ